MLAGKRIAVVMPAYNEARLIGTALDAVPAFVDHIIVVDDGSVDETGNIARASVRPVEVVEHAVNQGVGAAITTGCARALTLGADLTAVMAGDAQMDPLDLPTLLAPLIVDQADYVKGNRLAWHDAREVMPAHRWLGNHVLSFLTRLAVGVNVGDSQCGYVAMNRATLRLLPQAQLWDSYGYPNDWLSWMVESDLRICEVPVRPIYGEERSGITLRHAMWTIPFVIGRARVRRHLGRDGVDVVAGSDELRHEAGSLVRTSEVIPVDLELLGAGDRRG